MACLELTLKCMSVNGIIQLMGSVCIGPKVIPLSGAHCMLKIASLKIWSNRSSGSVATQVESFPKVKAMFEGRIEDEGFALVL
jgi:hypothetical protein